MDWGSRTGDSGLGIQAQVVGISIQAWFSRLSSLWYYNPTLPQSLIGSHSGLYNCKIYIAVLVQLLLTAGRIQAL